MESERRLDRLFDCGELGARAKRPRRGRHDAVGIGRISMALSYDSAYLLALASAPTGTWVERGPCLPVTTATVTDKRRRRNALIVSMTTGWAPARGICASHTSPRMRRFLGLTPDREVRRPDPATAPRRLRRTRPGLGPSQPHAPSHGAGEEPPLLLPTECLVRGPACPARCRALRDEAPEPARGQWVHPTAPRSRMQQQPGRHDLSYGDGLSRSKSGRSTLRIRIADRGLVSED
jgi:hypothetical protein